MNGTHQTQPAANAREERHILWAALFSNGMWDMLSVIVPLYAAAIGLSPAEIGLIVAARSMLPAVLSIHGGILMDRWGSQHVIAWLGGATAILCLLYPVAGWFVGLVALQLVVGLASSLANAGAQTWNLQSSGGDTAALARFSLVSRLGTFIGPILVGATWDAFGAFAAFACVSVWACGVIASAMWTRPQETAASSPGVAEAKDTKSVLAALVPSWSEHVHAFALAAIPAVMFVLVVTVLRNASGAIQSSFYVVYLGDAGFSGTMIGVLVGLVEISGAFGALLAAPLERLMRPQWILIACIVSSIIAISITPLIGGVLALLIAAAVVRGVGQGIGQPVMYSILGRAVPRAVQGATVGLRHMVSRAGSMVTPIVMGVAASLWGVETSFYVMGALFLAASAAVVLFSRQLLVGR